MKDSLLIVSKQEGTRNSTLLHPWSLINDLLNEMTEMTTNSQKKHIVSSIACFSCLPSSLQLSATWVPEQQINIEYLLLPSFLLILSE